MDIKKHIASIENYPSEGIVFRDISPLLADGQAFKSAIQEIVAFCKDKEVEMIVLARSSRVYRRVPSCL